MFKPRNPSELARALLEAANKKKTISLCGNSSKRLMAGPTDGAAVSITTSSLSRVLKYEPNDLTISVEAGLPWRELTRVLAENGQMVPLDPPFADSATVGGVVAANCSGPRRRLYGTARDLVIGMTFATLEGKLVQTGGMVVKNVAGLDMGKLMIGSFGTLAAIASVNFKVQPAPPEERSFLLPFANVRDAITVRDRILASPLQPSALDLLNPQCAEQFGGTVWLLALRAGGSAAALRRYEEELAHIAGRLAVETECPPTFWQEIEACTPEFLKHVVDGVVVRVSCTLKELENVMESFPVPALARAASGVCYGYFEDADAAPDWIATAVSKGWKAVIEFAPETRKHSLVLWPSPGGDFELMRRIKAMFDPSNLLNRGRLYRRI